MIGMLLTIMKSLKSKKPTKSQPCQKQIMQSKGKNKWISLFKWNDHYKDES